MTESRNRFFSKLATNIDSSGDVTAAAISSSVSLGANVYDSAGELPISGVTPGTQAFVTSTSRIYINSGLGWYNVAVINNTPTVQSILDSDGGTTPFNLATDGTPTTITITAQDSDGDVLTYNYSADSDFGGLATLSQADNVFTITPFSQDSATTTSGTITFTVTDGVNTATPGVQTFNLSFGLDWSTASRTSYTSTGDIGYKHSIDIDATTETAVVGNFTGIVDGQSKGYAKVLTFNGSQWVEQEELTAGSESEVGGGFGRTVSISGDVIVTGARDINTYGDVFIFKRTGSSWSQVLRSGPSLSPNYDYGNDVRVDGYTAVVAMGGFRQADVYKSTNGGSSWTRTQTIGEGTADGDIYRTFMVGGAFDIGGNVIVATAAGYDVPVNNAGGLFIYERADENSAFPQRGVHLAANGVVANEYWGNEAKTDGTHIVMSAAGAGLIQIFDKSSGTWEYRATIDVSPAVPLSLDIDGDTLVIGLERENSYVGKALIYQGSGANWSLVRTIDNPSSIGATYFGASSAVDDNIVMIGSSNQSGTGEINFYTA